MFVIDRVPGARYEAKQPFNPFILDPNQSFTAISSPSPTLHLKLRMLDALILTEHQSDAVVISTLIQIKFQY
jgi:hypothetical protein